MARRVISMRLLLLVSSLLLAFAGAAATESGSPPESTTSSTTAPTPRASDARPKPEDKRSPAEVRKLGADYLAQCMRDWDAATHMTKQEWARTCERVVKGRIKFRLEQGM